MRAKVHLAHEVKRTRYIMYTLDATAIRVGGLSADDSGGKEFRQLRLQKRRDVSGAKSDSSTSAAIMARHVFELNWRKSTSANKYLSNKYFGF